VERPLTHGKFLNPGAKLLTLESEALRMNFGK